MPIYEYNVQAGRAIDRNDQVCIDGERRTSQLVKQEERRRQQVTYIRIQ